MSIERERKFLWNENVPFNVATLDKHKLRPSFIKQGYLLLGDKGRQLRVRIINNSKAFICYKFQLCSDEKNEFEYEIPLSDGWELLANAECDLKKTRYSKRMFVANAVLPVNVDVDFYSNGLKVVEIENVHLLNGELPEYVGQDVTGRKEYSNIVLARELPKEL